MEARCCPAAVLALAAALIPACGGSSGAEGGDQDGRDGAVDDGSVASEDAAANDDGDVVSEDGGASDDGNVASDDVVASDDDGTAEETPPDDGDAVPAGPWGGEDALGTLLMTRLVAALAVTQALLSTPEDGYLLDMHAVETGFEEIARNMRDALVDPACAVVEWVPPPVRIDATFGADCVLSHQRLGVSGALALTYTWADSATPGTITLRFPEFAVGGQPLGASVIVEYRDAHVTTRVCRAAVSSEEAAIDLDGSLTVYDGGLVADGAGTIVGAADGRTIEYALTGLDWAWGDCWPSGGSVALTFEGRTETLEFLPETPTTGRVRFTWDATVETLVLLPYGACPSGP
jgi:hypothetical protein